MSRSPSTLWVSTAAADAASSASAGNGAGRAIEMRSALYRASKLNGETPGLVNAAGGSAVGTPSSSTTTVSIVRPGTVSYTHLRAHETRHDLVCRLLLEKKKK